MVTVVEALAIGTRHHQTGQLAEAEKIYRQVLAAEPQNAQALHLLGLLALQSRRFDEAVELIGAALRVDPMQAAFHANFAEAQRHLGNVAEAIACYRKALKLDPRMAQAHGALGNLLHGQGQLAEAADAFREALRLKPEDTQSRARLGQVLHDQNKLAEAEACFRRVLRSEIDSAEAHFNLAAVLQAQGKLDEAAKNYRGALALEIDYSDAHNNLGTILREQGSTAEAIAHFQAALAINPQHASAHVNLGAIYQSQDRIDEAVVCYQAALQVDAKNTAARNGLGGVYQRQGKFGAAVAVLQESLRINPRDAEAHVNLGNVCQAQGKLAEAAAECEAALRIDPNDADALNNIGLIRNEQGRRDEAIAASRRAIALKPDFAQAHNNLAVALQSLGRLEEALDHHRQATALSPLGAAQCSNLLYALNYDPRYDSATLLAEHRAWAARHADPLTAASPPLANAPAPHRRLRIGYVSAHFRDHAVNFFSEPILASHDHARCEVFCYFNDTQEDTTTARLRGYADHWRNIGRLSDAQASDLIRQDRIDILVDLSGHIGGHRLHVFARKPAPVQVTYLGYQNTTGMLAMDYRLTDDYADPPGTTDSFYTETLVRLPRSFFCYRPSPDAPPVGQLPALENGYITFGSFNSFAKVTPQVLATWARVLLAVDRSRLIILADASESLQRYLAETFASQGVGVERLTLAGRRPRPDYLELMGRVDIALDPFPFNGHTTTCDALWQGVPVVSLSGQTYVSRFGGSGLATLGLAELVARSPEEYLEIATALAVNVDRLGQLRASLRPRMAASPLLDFVGFTRNLEAAYRGMWAQWCAGHSLPGPQARDASTDQ